MAGKRRVLPRYAAIRGDLERAILSGHWPPGHKVPSEHELVARYRCARMTVNKALCELAAAGLIVRQRRAGSFVAAPNVEQSVIEIHDIEAEAKRGGMNYCFVLASRSVRRASASDAARLGVTKGTLILALQSVHHVAAQPFAIEDRLINLAAVPAARAADFSLTSPGNWLLTHIPWSRARHRISAISADAQTARTLHVSRGAACLEVERKTWIEETPVTQVRLVYPGDRHHLLAHFSPATGGRSRAHWQP
jgi:GntR family histidine utilization transcriptional repressor